MPLYRKRVIKPRVFSEIPITSGRVLHLDATISSSCFDATTGGSQVKLCNRVARWEDQSGNSRNATQSNAGARPQLLKIGDMSGMFFDGGSNFTGSFPTLSAQTICMAGIFSFVSANCRVFTQRDGNSGLADSSQTGNYIPIIQSSGDNKFASYASGFRSATATNSETPLIICAIHTGSSLYTRLNGINLTAYSHTLNGTFTQYSIGGNFGVEQPKCLIFEVVAYNSGLSDANLLLIENYFKEKYEIY
jgi:hypothetical protein